MKMMKGGGAKKMMRQMEAMRGKGGFPGMQTGILAHLFSISSSCLGPLREEVNDLLGLMVNLR